jgi:seryl-tRNA(Sec) selenium transferase
MAVAALSTCGIAVSAAEHAEVVVQQNGTAIINSLARCPAANNTVVQQGFRIQAGEDLSYGCNPANAGYTAAHQSHQSHTNHTPMTH